MPTGLQKTNKKQKKEQPEQNEQTSQKSQKQKTKKRTPPDLFLPDSFTYEDTSSPVNTRTTTCANPTPRSAQIINKYVRNNRNIRMWF